MPEMDVKTIDMPKNDTPLAPIVSWYNLARQRANAPNLQLEAHWLGISIPRLRNIIDVSRFDDTQIELLDKYSIELSVAARISQISDKWESMLTEEYLDELSNSPYKLTDIWLTRKGDSVDTNDIWNVFIKEGYCGKAYQARLAKFGKAKPRSFEYMVQDILRKAASGQALSQKQTNAIFQAINQERDSEAFSWTSERLRSHCPKSVELVENWDGI
tara:strand:+ start:336 stop:983 length:648 start_codon:yes stop_codon:yes gene_type:complete